MKTYNYYTSSTETSPAITIDGDLLAIIEKSESRYSTAKKYVDSYYTPIWRWAEKAYHMSTADRRQYIKSWQSNIAF